MCGRFVSTGQPDKIADYFDATADVESLGENYNVAPTNDIYGVVADAEGNAASMTLSNGEGSGYIVPGTGIMLNNMLGEDDLHPEGFHADPPGERVASIDCKARVSASVRSWVRNAGMRSKITSSRLRASRGGTSRVSRSPPTPLAATTT